MSGQRGPDEKGMKWPASGDWVVGKNTEKVKRFCFPEPQFAKK